MYQLPNGAIKRGNETESADECLDLAFFGNGSSQEYVQFSGEIYVVDLVSGTCNYVLLVAIIGFMAVTLFRKNKLQWDSWLSLALLTFSVLIVAVSQANLSTFGTKNCSFTVYMIDTIDAILLFNISLVLAHKIYLVSSDVLEFVLKGNLQSERYKKRNKIILRLIWFFSLV